MGFLKRRREEFTALFLGKKPVFVVNHMAHRKRDLTHKSFLIVIYFVMCLTEQIYVFH